MIMTTTMCTGMLIVRACTPIAREMDLRIHQDPYVENL
jgi:hypothetical protein